MTKILSFLILQNLGSTEPREIIVSSSVLPSDTSEKTFDKAVVEPRSLQHDKPLLYAIASRQKVKSFWSSIPLKISPFGLYF